MKEIYGQRNNLFILEGGIKYRKTTWSFSIIFNMNLDVAQFFVMSE